MDATEIVGRQHELAALAAFLDDVPAGSSALRVEGPAGIGKTTLLRHTLHAATGRGFRVLGCRPSEAEASFSYAAMADLLGDAAEVALRALPRPQRRALSIALLRTEAMGPPPDARAVSTAFVAALRSLALLDPVLVAVDAIRASSAGTAVTSRTTARSGSSVNRPQRRHSPRIHPDQHLVGVTAPGQVLRWSLAERKA